ncbi:ABC transporter permease subunit [Paenibacillus sp. J5C_2022]|uniref:ABC transporter permease n=1 Tax=Paenibacillus sp. J5C2022 TaxID=2977129 RepID=UPI0021D09AEC|nr:ABC transporter permease subunit [Paenibacillus sp. J5C2022]MCU6707725.1 ABC transporter permease subunit [Paenibacillus sp. J5C2022]
MPIIPAHTEPGYNKRVLKRQSLLARMLRQWQIQAMALLGLLFVLLFNYAPMFGIAIAFKRADYSLNLMQSLATAPWVGFVYFQEFFHDYQFKEILYNTLGLSLLQLLINFPAPILFAILISEVTHNRFKRIVQSISYFPHFVSWIVFGGIIINMLSVETGIIVPILQKLGLMEGKAALLAEPNAFWPIIIITSIVKGLGWGSIIYLAAITSIDPTLYEAAKIDGAGRFRRIWHITLPSISGTIIVFFLLSISHLLDSAFDQIWVFQTPLNLERSEVIDTFVYKTGIAQMRYSYTTAVGLFKSVIALILLVSGHYISKRIAGRGIF